MKRRAKKAAKRATTRPRAKANPPLVVWANPPRNVTVKVNMELGTVERVYYKHAKDGKRYQHPFTARDKVYAVTADGRRGFLILSETGKDLWDHYE